MLRASDVGVCRVAALLVWFGGTLAAGGAHAADEAQPRPSLEKIAGSPTCLSAAEAELGVALNAYRTSKGLAPLVWSKSLTLVAKWHAYDLEVNQAARMKDERGQPCGFHSWSDRGGERWSRLCYNSDPQQGEKMWGKPGEVTARRYMSNGYENVYYNSDGPKVTAARVLEFWKKHRDENDVMLQEGAWSVIPLTTVGIGFSEHHAVVWFGEEPDLDGELSSCGATPQKP